MTDELYRIVYCSRNRICADKALLAQEIQTILSKSREKNGKADITGALLYNAGSFAQVLEGALPAIERTFETIQCDPRHSDVTVIEIGPIAERQFAKWSMALAESIAVKESPELTTAFESVFANSEHGAAMILSTLQELVVSDIDWVLLDAA